MAIQSRVAQRQQIEAQAELARRLLAEMDNPTPLKPEVAAKAAAFNAEVTRNGWGDDREGRTFEELTTVEEDGDHLIWTGSYSELSPGVWVPKQSGTHKLCGRAHFQAARWAKEEQLGRALDQTLEPVARTCDERRCVAPAHHEVVRAARGGRRVQAERVVVIQDRADVV